jgi:hypothetical protein
VQRETWWKSYETISSIWRWIQNNKQSKKNENEAFETKTFWWTQIWQIALSQTFITLTTSVEWIEAMYAKKKIEQHEVLKKEEQNNIEKALNLTIVRVEKTKINKNFIIDD